MVVFSVILADFAWCEEKSIEWKAQSYWGENSTPYKEFTDFCERIRIMTNGRLVITLYPGGKLVPHLKTMEALKHDALQLAHQAGSYWADIDAGFAPVCELPGAWTNVWQVETWIHHKGGIELLRELYTPHNIYPIGVTAFGIESLTSKVPIRRMEDFKGHKVRVSSKLQARMFEKMGAQPMFLAGDKILGALEKGVIQIADWGTPSINSDKGLYNHAKHINFPGFHGISVSDISVNKKRWEELPADIQEILLTAVRDLSWNTVARVAIEDYHVVSKLESEGYTVYRWSKEDFSNVRYGFCLMNPFRLTDSLTDLYHFI